MPSEVHSIAEHQEVPRAERIARLNDALRKNGQGGAIMVTRGVRALPGFKVTALLLMPAPAVAPAPTLVPTVAPNPTATPPAGSQVRVTSIAALLDALADNAVTEIVVANGTYRVSMAVAKRSDSLWIGSRFAGRTNPVTVRAETSGGVTFDGGGTTYFGGISFEDGAHHQTWDGFTFANGVPTDTGVIVFGGYPGQPAPYNITLRNITIPRSVTSTSAGSTDHGIYFSQAVGGPHDILIDGLTVDGAGGLDSALHFYHSDASNKNAWNVTVRNMTVYGTDQAIILWDSTVQNIVIDGATVTNALSFAVRFEGPGQNIILKNITSTGSGSGKGFHSSLGPTPPGLTMVDNSFN